MFIINTESTKIPNTTTEKPLKVSRIFVHNYNKKKIYPVAYVLTFFNYVLCTVVGSMRSVLKIDGSDVSKEIEDGPEIIKTNVLARGKP